MAGKSGDKRGGGKKYTTQRVDLMTLSNIKNLNYKILRQGIRMNQSEVIEYAVRFALENKSQFLEYVWSERSGSKESAFDTLVRVTGKPWFPYGNLVEME